MIQVKELTKDYGRNIVLNIPELNLQHGECLGLVGNNGAGKTTFFRLILDLIEATNGNVTINNEAVTHNENWKNITGSYLDEGFLIDFLSPLEYFSFVGNLYGLNKEDIELFIQSHSEFLGDDILQNKKLIRNLSKGNKSKVGVISALIGSPEIIILDEPFANLDPSSQMRLREMINTLKEQKVTILISSHDLNHVTEVCNRIILLEDGNIKIDKATTPDTLKELETYFNVN